MLDIIRSCSICPRNCNTNRLENCKGFCGASKDIIAAKAFLHLWEEPCISGTKGSGTVFFSGCNMKCVFCQNHTISHTMLGKNISIERLADIFLELQNKGAHNINLVSPTPYAVHIIEAAALSKNHGLSIPIIYNTNGYDSVETIKMLKGTVDIFLPDLKYYLSSTSKKYSHCENYFEFASKALLEMVNQVGYPKFNDDGMLESGVLIRHMLLPEMLEESKKIIKWIKDNLGPKIFISLMSQYTPLYKANEFFEINKKVNEEDYEELIDYFFEIGLENGFVQERSSADECYVPDFDLSGI